MHRFLLGHAAGNGADQLVDDCLAQIGSVPVDANLGFVYATDALVSDLDSVLTKLTAATGVDRWTGTVGVGIWASGQEY